MTAYAVAPAETAHPARRGLRDDPQGRIVRLFIAERWPVGTIAPQVNVYHHDVVERVQRAGVGGRANPVSRGQVNRQRGLTQDGDLRPEAKASGRNK